VRSECTGVCHTHMYVPKIHYTQINFKPMETYGIELPVEPEVDTQTVICLIDHKDNAITLTNYQLSEESNTNIGSMCCRFGTFVSKCRCSKRHKPRHVFQI